MLYLEDYLEMIEHLPQELRDRFTDMREMDLTVQNNMDSMEKRIRVLFAQCRRSEMSTGQADTEFSAIRTDYYKTLEDADEKVHIANQMYDLVDRYLRRLDSELFKFKCELEADNNGITEILEKRSLELDGASSSSNSILNANSQKENRYFGLLAQNNHSSSRSERYRPKPEKRRDSSASTVALSGATVEKRQAIQSTSSAPAMIVRPTTPTIILPPTPAQTVQYNLQHIGAGNAAIAAAASQAITATQQMQQGRRTASLKASYEAIHGNAGASAHDLLIGREMTAAAHVVTPDRENSSSSFSSQQRKHKKKMSSATNVTPSTSGSSSQSMTPSIVIAPPQQQPPPQQQQVTIPISITEPPAIMINENGLIVEQTPDGEWSYDPNEPRYCICNQVSYGDMVACDNEACPFEWFHYPCVGILQSPKGNWYCPKCTASMKRRGARK